MDLLSQRYANPYIILDDFIRLGQLHDFSIKILKMISDEQVEKIRWEFYLHKVFDKSYAEYVAECELEQKKTEDTTMPTEEAMNIIEKSNSILDGFTL